MNTTEYTDRVTIAVPKAHINDANQIALILGESAADDKTFGEPRYQDLAGNHYSVCSTVVKPVFTIAAAQPLQPPSFAAHAELASASRAQQRLRIGTLNAPEKATPDIIAVIKGDSLEGARQHITALGLTPLPSEEENTQ
ncbi:hypothetical protein HZS80_20805 [Halomonas glaciei]|uniref:Uncharacterized protein n=1 Tax=Vreelandella glaciei TaxID=186761 RepID=A0A7Z0LWX1_9GAMM|nr:hypothetical protein [Halomonas glaciei]NYS80108.1 hypothetical protein [Halomonas glaciei]